MSSCLLLSSFILIVQLNQAGLVARWDFDGNTAATMTHHGEVEHAQPGPRPPEFPDMPADNTSVRFNGQGAYLSIPDEGENSRFDFTNGDSISIEAWVRVEQSGSGPRYVIGKGRTNSPGFARDNQNWALRIESMQEIATLSCL